MEAQGPVDYHSLPAVCQPAALLNIHSVVSNRVWNSWIDYSSGFDLLRFLIVGRLVLCHMSYPVHPSIEEVWHVVLVLACW